MLYSCTWLHIIHTSYYKITFALSMKVNKTLNTYIKHGLVEKTILVGKMCLSSCWQITVWVISLWNTCSWWYSLSYIVLR